MAERENKPLTAREIDEFNQNAATAARLDELKAAKTAETEETPQNQDQNSENSNPNQIETELGRQKNEAQKPGATGQLAGVAEDIVKKQVKKQLVIWALPVLGTVLFWMIIAFVVGLIVFALVSVYMCVEKKGTLSTLWTTGFGTDFTKLLNESFSGTCIADTSPAPKPTGDTKATEAQ